MNVIQSNINYFLEQAVVSFNRKNFFIDVSDEYSCNGIQLTGKAFQLAFFCDALLTGNKLCIDQLLCEKILVIKEDIAKRLKIHFNNNIFNYFDKPFIPDDLDTASMICSILVDDEEVTQAFLCSLDDNRLPNGHIPTWFGDDFEFNRVRFKSGNRPYHIEVELNACLTILNCNFVGFENYIDRIINIDPIKDLTSHWYFLSSYPLYLYSTLRNRIQLPLQSKTSQVFGDLANNLVKNYELFHQNWFANNFSVPFPEIKGLQKNVGSSTVLLDRILFTGSILNLLKEDQPTIIKEKLFTKFISDVDRIKNDYLVTPYWSLGFRYYNSEIFTIALIIKILCEISNFQECWEAKWMSKV